MRLNGDPLENFSTVVQYVRDLEPSAARHLWDSYADEDPARIQAHSEVTGSITAAYAHVRALHSIVTAPTSPIVQSLWADQQAQQSKRTTKPWEWPAALPMAEFRTALTYLLELEPEDVTALYEWWPDQEAAKRGVTDQLDAVRQQLDRLERNLAGRGGWPR